MDRPPAIDRLAEMVLENESRATEVARLLHDNAGQTLTAIGFHLQALGGEPEATAQIQEYLSGVLENIRVACNKLQTNVIERSGLSLAIELLVNRFQMEAALRIRTNINVERKVSASLGFSIYRVIELALDNVAMHAGVTQAELQLTANDSGIVARISDNGCGFDPELAYAQYGGTGLVLMNAYANSSQLHLRLDSSPSHGTIVQIQTI
jgi:signal transduction histidine kinase